MFAGKMTTFVEDSDDPDFDKPVLIEVTDTNDGPNIEIATNTDDKRIYLSFRLEDLKREIKELSAS